MKKPLLVLAALLLTGASLTACDDNSKPTTTEVDTKLAVSVEASEGTSLSLNKEDGKYDAGEKVEFVVKVTDNLKELKGVILDDEELSIDSEGKGHFYMPNKAVTLKTIATSIGDGSLLKVTKLADDAALPSTMDEVKAAFEASSLVQGKFASKENVEVNYSDFTWARAKLESKGSRKGGVVTKGIINEGVSVDASSPYFYQAGLEGETHAYTISSTGSYRFSDTPSFSLKPVIYKVVDEVSDKTSQVSKEGATKLSQTQDFVSMIKSKILDSYSIFDKTNTTIVTEVDPSKEFYTLTVSSIYEGYSSTSVTKFVASIDGDSFVRSVDFDTTSYDSSNWDKENKKPVEGATAKTTGFLDYSATRGYKEDFDLEYDINDFVMHDYDVQFLESTTGSYSSNKVDADKVSGNAKLTYQVWEKGSSEFSSIKPKMVGITEGFGEIASNGLSVAEITKLGEFEITFDNGLGETKVVKLTSLKPKASKLAFSLSSGSSIFAESATEVTVSVTPSLADQDATLELDTSYSSGVDATIVSKGNGVYSITPASVGTVYLVAKANNGQLSSKVSYKVIEKPSLESIMSVLTEKTIYKSGSYSTGYNGYYINFNADGTGKLYVGSSDDGYYSVEFTYSIDPDTLKFSFTFPSHEGKKVWYEIESFSYASSSSISGSFVGEYNNKADNYSFSMSTTARKTDSYFED